MDLPNGHRFVSKRKRGECIACSEYPEEKYPPARNSGDYGCLLCGSWTTYCISQEEADKKMGPCPKRVSNER